MSDIQPELYTEHQGTVRISGRTMPKAAAFCALTYLQKGAETIDFFYIGGNAGQQAMKAMSIFSYLVEKDSSELDKKLSIAFKPMRFLTNTTDPVTKEVKAKDAAVWRVVLLTE